MNLKKLLAGFLFLCLSSSVCAQNIADLIKQTLLINTHFKCLWGQPTWLLIIREVDTGRVLPYIYEIKNNDSFMIAFSTSHHYQVTASNLKFSPCAVIHNFCGLEGCPISNKSMFIRITGELTPDPCTSKCHVNQYQDIGLGNISM